MKRKIKYTIKNLYKAFKLPCVKSIIKYKGEPFLYLDKTFTNSVDNIVPLGSTLIEHDDGTWEVAECGEVLNN
jgi:hypothetical protein